MRMLQFRSMRPRGLSAPLGSGTLVGASRPVSRALSHEGKASVCLALGTRPECSQDGAVRRTGSSPADRELEVARLRDQAILEAIRRGDRAAVAEFVLRYGALIRLRVRERLGPSVRRVFDSEDLLSTLVRRMDSLIERGAVRAESPAQLWELLTSIMVQAASEYARRAMMEERRAPLSAIVDMPSPVDAMEEVARRDAAESLVRRTVAWRLDQAEHAMLRMRIGGSGHDEIALALRCTVEAVRMRWIRLRQRLRTQVEGCDLGVKRAQ